MPGQTGLSNDTVNGISLPSPTDAAATTGGLSISRDRGLTWKTIASADGIGSDFVLQAIASGTTVCVATAGGLSIQKAAERHG